MLTYFPDHINSKIPFSALLGKTSRDFEDSVFQEFINKILEETANNVEYNKQLILMTNSYKNTFKALFSNALTTNKETPYSESNFRRSNLDSLYYSEFLSTYTNASFSLNYNALDAINQSLPLFFLPLLNRTARNLLPKINLYYNGEYNLLNTLTLEDFRKIHLSKNETEFQIILEQLAEEYKINPFYTKANETDEFIKRNFIDICPQTFSRYDNLTPQNVKKYMTVRLEGLKFLASTIIYFNKYILNSFLVLKLDNNFADFHAEADKPSFTQLIESNTSLDKQNQFFSTHLFTFSKFVNNTYLPIEENCSKVKLLNKKHFAKAREAKIVKEINGLKVYSIFPKEWLDNFPSLTTVNKNLNFQKQLSSDFSFTKAPEHNLMLSVGPFDDISFVGDFHLYTSSKNTLLNNTLSSDATYPWSLVSELNNSIYENKEIVNLSTLCSESITFTNGKVTALVLNNFCTGSQPFTFEIKQVTKTQLSNSNNIFVPIAFKTTRIVSENLENDKGLEEEIYYVSLVNFSNFSNTFRKFTKAQKFIQYFNNLLCTENSAGLNNPSIYEEELKRKFGNLIKYSKIQKEKFDRVSTTFAENFAKQISNLSSLIDPSRLSFLNGKLNIDESVISKLNKLKETKEKINEKLMEEADIYDHFISEQKESNSQIENLKNQIQSLSETIKNYNLQIENITQKSLNTLPIEIEKQRIRLEKQQELNNKFLITFNAALKQYQEEEQKALETKNFLPDSFFDGLSTKGLFLTELVLDDSRGDRSFYRGETINNLTQDLYSKSKVNSLEFVIAKPFEIKVDGDQNNIIYAGPLKVKVSNESIQVAALDSSTIFAFINENTAVIHPHASNFGIHKTMNLKELWSYRRGCLGEASPYIYNSFRENSLKMIIVNTLVWLTSANSSDAWGRNYKFFPKKSDMNLENLDSLAIDVDSLINFIRESKTNFETVTEVIEYLEQNDTEEDDDFCDDHDFNDAGFCIHCGYYNEEYDLNLLNEDEDEEEILPTSPLYIPYIQLTNTNNNQG